VLTGLQQQTKHADFAFRIREQNMGRIPQIRNIANYLKTTVPSDARILNVSRVYVDSEYFSHIYYKAPTLKYVEKKNIEYLLLEKNYPLSLKREGVSLKISRQSVTYQQHLSFWNALMLDGVQGRFRIQKEFADIGLTLYQRNVSGTSRSDTQVIKED